MLVQMLAQRIFVLSPTNLPNGNRKIVPQIKSNRELSNRMGPFLRWPE